MKGATGEFRSMKDRWDGMLIRTQAALIFGVVITAPVSGAELDSVLEVPVRLPLAPLFTEIEQLVPWEIRRDRSWENHGGTEVRFAARRGPLELHAQGDTLFLRTTVAYWLKARKRLLGKIPVTGSCGIEEPPRLAVITLAVHFGILPDWRVGVQSAVLPPAFLNPCRMTAAGIDVTGALGKALQERLWRTVSRELARIVAESGDGRKLAADLWARLQSPLSLDGATWLVLNPKAVWATQPLVHDQEVSLSVGLAAQPHLVSGAAPAVDKVPLPVLRVAAPRMPVMRFPVQLSVDYADADALLRARLSGQSFSWAGNTVVVEESRLVVDGTETLSIEATVSGDVSGRLRVTGLPAYDAEARELYVDNVNYKLETEDTEVRKLDAMFHELVTGVIAERARWPLGERIQAGLQQFEQVIGQVIPEPYRLQTVLDDVQLTDFRLSENAMIIRAVFEGTAQFVRRPIPSGR